MKPKGNGDPRDGKKDNPGNNPDNKSGYRDYQPEDDDFDADFKGKDDGVSDEDFDQFGEEDDDYDDALDEDEEDPPFEQSSTGFPRKARRAYRLVASKLAAQTKQKSRSDFWLRIKNSSHFRHFSLRPTGLAVLVKHIRLSQNLLGINPSQPDAAYNSPD